jgi:cytochrome c5
MRNKSILITMAIILTLGLALTSCGSKSTQAPTQVPAGKATVAPSTDGADGQTLLNTRCSVCHDLSRVTRNKLSADQWTQVVSKMVGNGAKLTSAEQKTLVDYLAKTYGP